MYDKSQLMRGILEGSILKVICLKITYGYEIVTSLQALGFPDMKEGTIYPLLVRLEKKHMITSEFRPSPLGPSRKYYSLTVQGLALLKEFEENWNELSRVVHFILSLDEFPEPDNDQERIGGA